MKEKKTKLAAGICHCHVRGSPGFWLEVQECRWRPLHWSYDTYLKRFEIKHLHTNREAFTRPVLRTFITGMRIRQKKNNFCTLFEMLLSSGMNLASEKYKRSF